MITMVNSSVIKYYKRQRVFPYRKPEPRCAKNDPDNTNWLKTGFGSVTFTKDEDGFQNEYMKLSGNINRMLTSLTEACQVYKNDTQTIRRIGLNADR